MQTVFTILYAVALAGGLALGHAEAAAAQSGHSGHSGSHMQHDGAEQAGEPGKPGEVSRTIEITIYDNYFEPESVSVAGGETVRFVIRNEGAQVHEFNIGTPAMHIAHQPEMQMMVDHGVIVGDRIDRERMKMDMGGGRTMEHSAPNSALLEPGKTVELIWKFGAPGDLEFACNVPGHYDAGMMGRFDFN